ncbi:DUF3320 domain-containing protein [Streptomyces sp. NPDC059994]|uniref:DUF3320 domain-containing protein n=1 Tax=Streptomyces sp. NPDC059994 TaxID=3347029 RepID=UPI00368FB531
MEREWSTEYRTSRISITPRHELHTPEVRPALRKVLAQVIEAEGPVHEDLLVQRAREAWGVGRAGTRIRDNVRQVALALVRSGLASADGSFFDVPEQDELRARRPQAGETPRKVTYIAPAERHLALYELAAECPGMSQDELIKQTCEFFGWRRVGKDIHDCLTADIAELSRLRRLEGGRGAGQGGAVTCFGGRLRGVGSPAPDACGPGERRLASPALRAGQARARPAAIHTARARSRSNRPGQSTRLRSSGRPSSAARRRPESSRPTCRAVTTCPRSPDATGDRHDPACIALRRPGINGHPGADATPAGTMGRLRCRRGKKSGGPGACEARASRTPVGGTRLRSGPPTGVSVQGPVVQ